MRNMDTRHGRGLYAPCRPSAPGGATPYTNAARPGPSRCESSAYPPSPRSSSSFGVALARVVLDPVETARADVPGRAGRRQHRAVEYGKKLRLARGLLAIQSSSRAECSWHSAHSSPCQPPPATRCRLSGNPLMSGYVVREPVGQALPAALETRRFSAGWHRSFPARPACLSWCIASNPCRVKPSAHRRPITAAKQTHLPWGNSAVPIPARPRGIGLCPSAAPHADAAPRRPHTARAWAGRGDQSLCAPFNRLRQTRFSRTRCRKGSQCSRIHRRYFWFSAPGVAIAAASALRARSFRPSSSQSRPARLTRARGLAPSQPNKSSGSQPSRVCTDLPSRRRGTFRSRR